MNRRLLIMQRIDKNLQEYVRNNIFPLYAQVDEGHNLENHILPVINQSISLANVINDKSINFNMVFVIAAYHDIGLIKGRDLHHIYSKKFVLKDDNLKKWFSSEEIRVIAEAIEDHRASRQQEPRSIYGMIISDSDRNVDLDEILLRTHLCIQTKFPNIDLSDFEKEFEKAYEWIIEKDSEDGYLNFYLDKNKQKRVKELHRQVANKELIKEKYYIIYNNKKDC